VSHLILRVLTYGGHFTADRPVNLKAASSVIVLQTT